MADVIIKIASVFLLPFPKQDLDSFSFFVDCPIRDSIRQNLSKYFSNYRKQRDPSGIEGSPAFSIGLITPVLQVLG